MEIVHVWQVYWRVSLTRGVFLEISGMMCLQNDLGTNVSTLHVIYIIT